MSQTQTSTPIDGERDQDGIDIDEFAYEAAARGERVAMDGSLASGDPDDATDLAL